MDDRTARELWEAVSSTYSFAETELSEQVGQTTCLRLRKIGDVVRTSDSFLVRVCVVSHAEIDRSSEDTLSIQPVHGGQTALLRVRLCDYFSLVQHVEELNAVWTHVHLQAGEIILDSTIGPAFLSGRVPVDCFETIRVAELFAGGFCGWSQAAYCLQQGGLPVRRTWMLDNAREVVQCIQTRYPDMEILHGPADFDAYDTDNCSAFLCADFNDKWWQRIWTLCPPDIVTASPPCQPWSSAGRQGGLQSPDGVLFLSLVSMAKITQVPVFCVEEVQGFLEHPDSKIIMQAWDSAGYDCVYKEVVDLAEVAPTHRTRLLLVFLHRQHAVGTKGAFQVVGWQKLNRPGFLAHKAYFPVLPEALVAPCKLDNATLEKYLDPWYFPPAAAKRDPTQYRVCALHGQAQCFMAAYHSQHTLPEFLLESKGLLGSILRDHKGYRFFAAPEIAVCHGVVEPMLFYLQDQVAMKILGNSLAIPQAILALSHALQLFPGIKHPHPADMVALAHTLRIKSDSCVLLHIKSGWLLCGHDSLGAVLAKKSLRLQMEQGLRMAKPVFHRIDVVPAGDTRDHDVLEVFFSVHLTPQEALVATGLQWDQGTPQLCLDRPLRIHIALVQQPPTLELPVDIIATPPVKHAICVLTPQGVVCLHRGTPDIFAQLRWAFEWACSSRDASVHCFDFYGRRCSEVANLPGVVLVVPTSEEVLFPVPSMPDTHIQAFKLGVEEDGFCVEVQPHASVDWWLQWPRHLLPNLGWSSHFQQFPPLPGEPLLIHIKPACTILRLQARALRKWLRELLFLAQLESTTAAATQPGDIPVIIQVQGRAIAKMYLPGTVQPSQLEDFWRHASLATGCWPNCRIFSGPFPLPFNEAISAQPAHRLFRKLGCLYVTVMTEARGGGAKAENNQLAINRLASACLERGVALDKASTAAAELVQSAGARACLSVFESSDYKNCWTALQALAAAQSVQWPEGDNQTERAAKRIQRAVKKRQLRSQLCASASAFRLDPSVWLSMDELPAQILEKVELHASGIYFTDASESSQADLELWAGINSDALAVVFLGHTCPDPSTCSGPVTAPATCVATGSRHLLACCYHNVGSTPIRPTFAANAEVDFSATVCCSFSMQKDDVPESTTWADIIQGPVRAVQQAFAAAGVSKAILSPWGRSYQAGGRASTPNNCDALLFRAKVPKPLLPTLLQKSGFNHVYVVPRDWDDRPQSGWRIVWLTSARADAVRQSALLPSQHGLVRSKNKYGFRVPSDNFAEAFKKLRPQDKIPVEIEVRELYKLGPVHIGVTAEGLATWAASLKWPVRILRSLGPVHWLLGASAPPPTECPCLNGTPVLLTRIPGKAQAPPVVISHAAPALQQGKTNQPSELPEDPWMQNDPWSQYRARSKQAAKPSTAPSSSSHAAARVSEAANTSRIQALEHGLAALQAQHVQSVKDREVEKQQVAQEFQNLRGDMQGLHKTMTNQVQAGLESLRNAQQQQERQLQGSIDELKHLLLQNVAEKKPRKDPGHNA